MIYISLHHYINMSNLLITLYEVNELPNMRSQTAYFLAYQTIHYYFVSSDYCI